MRPRRTTIATTAGFNHISVFNQELLNPITHVDDPAL
jgi:hypothetical protein